MFKEMTTRKKIGLIIMLISIIMLGVYGTYVTFYRLDFSRFSVFFSPTAVFWQGDYQVIINLYKESHESEIGYLLGRVRAAQTSESFPLGEARSLEYNLDGTRRYYDMGRTIFWQRVQNESLVNAGNYWGVTSTVISFYWVDDETVSINGIEVNIYRGMYDFRRDFRRWRR